VPPGPRDRLIAGLNTAALYPRARALVDSVGRFTPEGRRVRRRMLALYREFVRPGDLCFDIGANVGNRTELFLALGAHVVAVEPQALCARKLRRRFGSNAQVAVVSEAAGRARGEAELLVSTAHTISSMSADWVERVRASRRFGSHTWSETTVVPVTTLDALIEEYGNPSFCKIDVEGYEAEVLAGLSKPIRALSFEFTPEAIEGTIACLRRLAELGPSVFNYSIGDTGTLALEEWVDDAALAEHLARLDGSRSFGDVYAQLDRVGRS
jgi:FkbM family methyltransferase